MYLRDCFALKPYRDYSLCWSAFYPNLRFTLSLQSAFYTQSAFYPWSAVCSPQSDFTLTVNSSYPGVRQTQTADLQTCRLADSKICRRPTFFVTGLWANFIHPLFTVGESQIAKYV